MSLPGAVTLGRLAYDELMGDQLRNARLKGSGTPYIVDKHDLVIACFGILGIRRDDEFLAGGKRPLDQRRKHFSKRLK